MLSLSKTSIPETLLKLKELNVSAAFLVPTATGLDKSIMDAHVGVKDWFLRSTLHDFDAQQQGSEHKVTQTTTIISEQTIVTKTSLYRPRSKNGDPRIWPNGLKKHCTANELLVLLCLRDELIVINASRCEISRQLFDSHPKLRALLRQASAALPRSEENAAELLEKLELIGKKGWITTMRPGATGIGFTLEKLLGIHANNGKTPDYKGIELNSRRKVSRSNQQVTLFSKVPDWSVSRLKGTKALLLERGRFSEKRQRIQLFHEVSCAKRNSYNMQLALIDARSNLVQFHVDDDYSITYDVQWAIETLQQSFEQKHRETMWVSASTVGTRSNEKFKYEEVTHAYGHDSSALLTLLESGAITVHYTMAQKPNGSVKDQGFLFKISPKYLPALFKNQKTYYF